MLRQLYKTLLISIMCGSLSIMNTVAFAQQASSSNMGKAKETEVITRDANGVYKKTEKHSFGKIDDPDMLASITMLAVGSIAGRMAVSYKPLTTDVTVAAAGGAAFMVGEIMSNMSFKKKMENMSAEITKSSDGKKDQAQIERLQDLKTSYEEAKKTTGTKKMLQTAAAVAFAGAAALAAYEAYEEYTLFATCMMTIKNQIAVVQPTTGCAESKTPGAGAALALNCGACLVGLNGLLMQLETINLERQTPGPSMVENGAVFPKQTAAKAYMSGICKFAAPSSPAVAIAAVTPACTAALAAQSVNQIYSYKPTAAAAHDSNNLLNKILFGSQVPKFSYEVMQSRDFNANSASEKFLDLFFPKAEAGWLPLLGLGGSAAAAYFLITGTMATTVDMQMFVPFNRAIAFGGLAALSYLAANSSQNQMDKMDENIAKIDQILNEMNGLANGVKTSNVQERQIRLAGFNPNVQTDIQINPDAKVKTDCATSAGNSGCTPLADQLKNMPGFANLPESFKGIASQSAKMGDGLSGTNVISASTLSTAANLANKSNAISKLLKNVQSKLNDQLEANGKPKIDFDKEQDGLIKKWNDQTSKGLNSKGMSAGAFLASAGISPMSSSVKKAAPEPVANVKKSLTTGIGGGVSAPSKNDKAFDLDFKEAGDGNFAVAGDASAGAAKDEKYDIGQNDINTNSGESIFQMISNRYLKSGYPKLLEEIPVKN